MDKKRIMYAAGAGIAVVIGLVARFLYRKKKNREIALQREEELKKSN